jgi:hypothetical protein
MAKSVDIGTCFLVAAQQADNGEIKTKSIRDAFFDMENNDPSVKNMLKNGKINYIEAGEKLYIIGDSAVTMANIFKRECRRPLSKGVLAPGELEAEKVLLVLLESILGKASTPGEICYYSIPGNPIDRNIDVVYHAAMCGKILSSLGYKAVAMNESAAIVYSNCAKEQFSALALSFGAGAVNVALLYNTIVGMTFSLSTSGDYIDDMAAKATGSTMARIQAIKEKHLNLLDASDGDPKTFREREALIIYYKSLILKTLDAIKNRFVKTGSGFELPESIPLILSGGTALPKGFKELFEEGFKNVKDTFTIPISEIRMANDLLSSVAQGLLVAALNYTE